MHILCGIKGSLVEMKKIRELSLPICNVETTVYVARQEQYVHYLKCDYVKE